MIVSPMTLLYLDVFLILDATLILILLRPKQPVVYTMQHATRSFNSQRRMFGQEELLGVSNLAGSRWDWKPTYTGPLRYSSRSRAPITNTSRRFSAWPQ